MFFSRLPGARCKACDGGGGGDFVPELVNMHLRLHALLWVIETFTSTNTITLL